MLFCCGLRLSKSRRDGVPDVGKLLYGKRKNAIHTASKAKPSVVGMLMQVPESELRQAAWRAANVKELNQSTLSEVLKKYRAVNRLDRSQVVVAVADEVHLGLTSSQYCTLMAHANDNKDYQTALHYWNRACSEKKANEKVHGALLAAYRGASRWKDAVQHYNAMLEDKMILDPYALHTVMNTCRRADACDLAISTFTRAVRSGATPNSAVYLELLRCMQQLRQPSQWKMSLDVLRSIEGKVDLTAGHFNAAMATMGGALWHKGVELFQTMKAKNVQPSRETLSTLASLNPRNLPHTVQCVAEAHTLGMPVTDAMYRAVLANLFRMSLDHEAVRFVEREFVRCSEDVSNPVNSSLSLSLAIVDSLLAHNKPQEALLFFFTFETKLSNIVGAATRGLGTVGLRSQRWIVQGRVAVVDHNVLLNPRCESLLSHYDSILVPFSSIRLLVRRVRESVGTVKGRYTKLRLKWLQEFTADTKTPVRVLPMAHQLIAHKYILDGPITSESVECLRETAQGTKAEEAQEQLQQQQQQQRSCTAPLLIRKRNTFFSATDFVAPFPGGELKNGAELAAAGKPDEPPVVSSCSSSGSRRRTVVLKNPERMSAPERVLAVAVMLKSLNPDASVHVLSPNLVQLQVVKRWNQMHPLTPLTMVRYPEEVGVKAPAEQQQLPIDTCKSAALVEENADRDRVLRQERRPLFVPS
ncbi:hypothetical protein TraAM80_04113 [Trypanosoma rangeli]|uniref:Uncharacterized protein n=1 Tax=Trypanosoma rangeli TaxID=5698 RepID=A0A422NKV6_TRYRA|nr:uncharacterized protein TraAM80_04113 [Trypanosoma rangeli]RNF06117.1 hypothetical protein TraAM80_04113 [Trypanosoma rangeli]|eukprot:RNF06117.1 hypothetical protein TraAM80_04113 [Trypanosoma rangeli]